MTRTARRLRLAAIVVGVLIVLGAAAGAALFAWASDGLPDAAKLADYAAPLPSTVRDVNGAVLTSYSRERRLYLTYDELPPRLVQAYISAEDKDFFTHGGDRLPRHHPRGGPTCGSAGRPRRRVDDHPAGREEPAGRNEVATSARSSEAILARRIEAAFTKQQILELYLNQIFLGRNGYGVEAAAQAYFGKSVADLDLAADGLSRHPAQGAVDLFADGPPDRAPARRDYVLQAHGGERLYHPRRSRRRAADAARHDRQPRRASKLDPATISSRKSAAR